MIINFSRIHAKIGQVNDYILHTDFRDVRGWRNPWVVWNGTKNMQRKVNLNVYKDQFDLNMIGKGLFVSFVCEIMLFV